jgi:hypothetical protein
LSSFSGLFGPINEKKIVAHIQTLSAAGFPPDRLSVRATAYRLAKEMRISNNFNDETKTAGHDWLNSFLRRNTKLSMRQADGLSLAIAQGMGQKKC